LKDTRIQILIIGANILAVSSNWWQTFFSGLIVDSWLQMIGEGQTKVEAEFLQRELGVSPPAKILDVPCGGGRHSLALAAAGYQMTGVDISPDFLKAARATAANLSPGPSPHRGGERSPGNSATCAICPGGKNSTELFASATASGITTTPATRSS
jgi:SAM-dependent methyltransferase